MVTLFDLRFTLLTPFGNTLTNIILTERCMIFQGYSIWLCVGRTFKLIKLCRSPTSVITVVGEGRAWLNSREYVCRTYDIVIYVTDKCERQSGIVTHWSVTASVCLCPVIVSLKVVGQLHASTTSSSLPRPGKHYIFVIRVMAGTIQVMLSVSWFAGRGSNAHVFLLALQIAVISVFVVQSNTSIQSVKQCLSSDGLSMSLKHCRPDRRLSICPQKKRENSSHSWAAKRNSGCCCKRWSSSDLSRRNMFDT